MLRLLTIILMFTTLGLFGCGANVKSDADSEQPLPLKNESRQSLWLLVDGNELSTGSEDWTQFRALWNESMSEIARAQGIQYTWLDQTPSVATEPATLVKVFVTDYRYVSQGARLGLGIMIGDAFINSTVTFTELPEMREVRKRKMDTTSSGGFGIFAAMTPTQVQKICDEIARMVTSKRVN